MPRRESAWVRNCWEAETLEDDILDYARDGVITRIELARIRRLLKRNTTRHDQNRCVVSLAGSVLDLHMDGLRNYDSQASKKNRRNRAAGYPSLAFVDGKEVDQEDDPEAA